MAATAFALSTGPALADAAPEPSAAFAGHLVAGPGATTVKITYTCSSTESPMSHLYIGVKQGPDVNETNSSSQYAKTFYSTNWKSDSGPNALNCDGTQHTQTVILKPQPGFDAAVPRLQAGPALVQLCVFDNVTEFDQETGEPMNGGFGFDYSMHDVRAGNGQG